MSASLETVLRLVAEGRLTADEADEILAALDQADRVSEGLSEEPETRRAEPGQPRYLRIEVMENGKRAVDLRLPTSLGELAMGRIPGLARPELDRIREAVRTGFQGPIIATLDEDGDGVRIVVE